MLHSEATCIYLDHHRISKFGSKFSHGSDLVCAVIQCFVNLAPQFISSRWKDEDARARRPQTQIPTSTKYSNVNETPDFLFGSDYDDSGSSPVVGMLVPLSYNKALKRSRSALRRSSLEPQASENPTSATREEFVNCSKGFDVYSHNGLSQNRNLSRLSIQPSHFLSQVADAPEPQAIVGSDPKKRSHPPDSMDLVSKRAKKTIAARKSREPMIKSDNPDKRGFGKDMRVVRDRAFGTGIMQSASHPQSMSNTSTSPLEVLEATVEERKKARAEVTKLLGQWTTCDPCVLNDREEEISGIGSNLAREVNSVTVS